MSVWWLKKFAKKTGKKANLFSSAFPLASFAFSDLWLFAAFFCPKEQNTYRFIVREVLFRNKTCLHSKYRIIFQIFQHTFEHLLFVRWVLFLSLKCLNIYWSLVTRVMRYKITCVHNLCANRGVVAPECHFKMKHNNAGKSCCDAVGKKIGSSTRQAN